MMSTLGVRVATSRAMEKKWRERRLVGWEWNEEIREVSDGVVGTEKGDGGPVVGGGVERSSRTQMRFLENEKLN